nr:hypothetical protein [Lachnospiraceae bacterium]
MGYASKRRENIITCLIFAFLLVLSVIGIWKTVYFGADIDESYALTMASRMVGGDRMMTDMWEPHQMSAFLYAPLVALYKGITGSLEGALVFMRFCGVAIQALVSVFLYATLKEEMKTGPAMVLSFVYFNFTPKHIQSPEFTSVFYWTIMLLMLFLLRFFRTEKRKNLVAAGICTSALVLCYPAAVLVFGYVAVLLLIKCSKKKQVLWYAATCGVCALLFVLYVVTVSGVAAFDNIGWIMMDESHRMSVTAQIKEHLSGLWEMLRVVVAMIVLSHVGRPVFAKKKNADYVFFAALFVMLAVYAVYQFHTVEKVNFAVFYPIVLQLFVVEWYFYIFFPKEEKDRRMFLVSVPVNGVAVLAVLLSSNVVTSYSMSFLMPAVILGAWQIMRVYEGREGRRGVWAPVLLGVCIVVQLFVSRICLVRYTSMQRKNIFETYYKVEHDVLKGIRLGEFDYIQYETKSRLLSQYVEAGDSFLYVGCDMFLYTQLQDARIATGNTISTPSFGEQLMAYYEKHPDRIPTVIFVDREYGMDFSQAVLQEPMRSFMEAHFDIENTVVEAAVTVYQRER